MLETISSEVHNVCVREGDYHGVSGGKTISGKFDVRVTVHP